MELFQWDFPCSPTDLVHFRKRIGEEGVEKVFQASVALHGKVGLEREVVINTTVQEKNITFPTDTKLRVKVIARGFRGRKRVGTTSIALPDASPKDRTEHAERKARQSFRRRSAIEPVIGHLKSDF